MADSRRTEPRFSQPQEKHLHYYGRYFFKWDLHIKIRLWLSRVTCILTDCGAERKIPDMRDILPEFLDAIGVKYPMGCRMEYLFPNALPAIGWHRVLDGVLQWGLNSLDFFTLLLKK